VRIAGRKKEIINRGGKKYFPREIEELLYQHPKIMQAAIIGAPDPRLGEKNCLCAIIKPGASLSLSEGSRGRLQVARGAGRDERLSDDAYRQDTPAGTRQARGWNRLAAPLRVVDPADV
jgi:acyl-CoA synthetase (AMP-forming)/AMP-acid ligase II